MQTPGPHYLQYYLDALQANGVTADVYDVDARGRVAPDHLGVLSHYDAVIWYTGDDNVTRRLGWGGGNADRLAMDEILEFRAYMNEGGRVLYTGAGRPAVRARRAVGSSSTTRRASGPAIRGPADLDPRRCCRGRLARRTATGQRRAPVLARRVRAGRGDGHDPETGACST